MKIYKLADNTIDSKDYVNMINFLKRRNHLTQSKITRKLKSNFSKFLKKKYSTFVNSGSSLIYLLPKHSRRQLFEKQGCRTACRFLVNTVSPFLQLDLSNFM